MKKMKAYLGIFIAIILLVANNSVAKAVDLQAIENQVRSQATQRQQPVQHSPAATSSPQQHPQTVIVERQFAESDSKKSNSVQIVSKNQTEKEVLHWSIFGGIIRLRTWNRQLLLSVF